MKSPWFLIAFALSWLGYCFQTLAFDSNREQSKTLKSHNASPLLRDDEEAIFIFRGIFKIQEAWAQIPTVAEVYLPRFSLMVLSDVQENEHNLHLFNAQTSAFLNTLSIIGRVVAIDEQGRDLSIDVQGPEGNERLYYRIVRNTEVLNQEQKDFIMFIGECLLFEMSYGVRQRTTIMAEDLAFLNAMPDHIRTTMRDLVQVEAKPPKKAGILDEGPNDN